MRIGLSLKTDAAVEPLTLAEAKVYLRVDTSDTTDDALISSLIIAARKAVENFTGRRLINQTWNFWLDRFPGERSPRPRDQWWDGTREGSIASLYGYGAAVQLPLAPLVSITSITTYDTTDLSTAMDLTTTVTDSASVPGRVFMKFGQIWPVNLRGISSVNIEFVTGYGATSAAVPADLNQAVRLLLSNYYENRDVLSESRVGSLPLSVESILNPYKVMGL